MIGALALCPAALADPPEGLTDLREMGRNWVIDMRYATENNTRGVPFYDSDDCFLREGTAKKLAKAEEYLEKRGYRLVILDAYRPQRAQQWLWDNCPEQDRKYLADPAKGSNHTRGSAVDVSLANKDGETLDMQSEYDDVTDKATRKYKPSAELKKRTDVLTKAMRSAGFKAIDLEWWHYSDSKSYPLVVED